MSESDITVDLSVVDRLTPQLDRLVSALAGVTPIEFAVDPVVTAAEVAVCAAGGACGSASITAAVLRLMPPHCTVFERGLALGMALVLAVRPEVGSSTETLLRDLARVGEVASQARAALSRVGAQRAS